MNYLLIYIYPRDLRRADIINQGSIIVSNVTAEFRNSYTDKAAAKIIAIAVL
jgi:hypothetical protein